MCIYKCIYKYIYIYVYNTYHLVYLAYSHEYTISIVESAFGDENTLIFHYKPTKPR
jgi:hypothetical protein